MSGNITDTVHVRAKLVPIRIAAESCTVAIKTMRLWIKTGVLRGRKLNGRWYALREDVDALSKEAPRQVPDFMDPTG